MILREAFENERKHRYLYANVLTYHLYARDFPEKKLDPTVSVDAFFDISYLRILERFNLMRQ